MPKPSSVHHIRRFATENERDAYAQGLENGASLLMQGHGSDPWRVRTENDLPSLDGAANPYIAYIQTGRYDSSGNTVFE